MILPNRIIKESICTSEQIDELSQGAEILFYRLMVNADDFGLFDARLKLIASKCFPLKSIDSKRLQADLAEICASGLVSLYEVGGRTYGRFISWEKHQQIRAKRAKFPLPENGHEIICNQLIANAPVIQSNPIQSESESNPNPIVKHRASRLPADMELSGDWFEFCKTERPDLDPQKIFDSFKDHWIAAPGAKGTKLDWFATWRNWVRNQKPQKPIQNGFKGTTEPSWRAEQRLRTAQAVPGIAARSSFDTFEVESFDVTTHLLD